jgi:alkaline phosphatase D
MKIAIMLGLLVTLAAGGFASGQGAAAAPELPEGVASGDVTATSAVLWARANGPATLETELDTDPAFTRPTRGPARAVDGATGFAARLPLDGLRPATRYHYRIRARTASAVSGDAAGSFVTAPEAQAARDVRLLWAGDLGGQGYCRKPDHGYTIFDSMTARAPDFVLFSGDMIYADSPCPAPPNLPGSEFVASTLEEYRQRWRYNRDDPHFQKFLGSTSMIVQWDDHEVKNDFGPAEPLMPTGLRALFEYHPIAVSSQERYRLYRKFRWGKELELFVLDNRQYRAPNTEPDGPRKTMLGAAQRRWLLDAVGKSDAVWKVIASSVPITVPTGTDAAVKGRDAWASGPGPTGPSGRETGWETELRAIFEALRARRVENVVWLTTDVHFAQFARLDAFGDGSLVMHELISGPLSAVSLKPPAELDATFHPQRLWAEGELFNFGSLALDAATHRVTAEIVGVPLAAPPGTPTEVRQKLVLEPGARPRP